MMFIVVADIKGYCIEYAIVAKRLLLFVVGEVVFLYPAGAKGMEADREEETEQEIGDSLGTEEIPDGCDEDCFGGPIDGNPFVKGLDLPQAGDTEYLEEGIEQQPEDLADEEIIDEPGFPAIGQIGIEFMDALERVMLNMIAFEGD